MTIFKRRAKIKIIKAKMSVGWYWTLVAGNGETVCVSEVFPSRGNAKRAASRARVLAATAKIVDEY